MKKYILLFLTLSFVSNLIYSKSNDQFFQYLSTSTVAASGEVSLIRPTALTGKSVSSTKIVFNWIDNSTNEDGYKFQREKAGIYWDFGCEAGANANYKEHNLSVNPELYERFRLFAYSGSSRSDYAYVGVQMLRPDIVIEGLGYYGDNDVNFYLGETIYLTYRVKNIGTAIAPSSNLKSYVVDKPDHIRSYGNPIGDINIPPLLPGNSYEQILTYVLPMNLVSVDQYVYFHFFCDESDLILETLESNNHNTIPVFIHASTRSRGKKSGNIALSNETDFEKTIEIYPNPSKGLINIVNTSAYEMIKVFDIEGKQVYGIKLSKEQSDNSINLTNCKPGVYFIKAIGESSVETKKFIIE